MRNFLSGEKFNNTLIKENKKSAYKPVIDQNDDKNPDDDGAVLPKTEKGGFLGFIKRRYPYLVVFVGILGLFACVLKYFGVYPFGKGTVSNYDMLAQVGPFIEHLFDVIKGEASLFYTARIAGGADVFGTICYCMVSPFTWVFLLFGEGNVYNGVGIVLPLKLVCVAFSALYYIEKKHKNVPGYVGAVCAVLYAFCGYMFVANTYINWVDFLIYMPFVCLGFERLVKEGKIRYFAISYALMIYTCFSISCFALILVFICAMVYPVVVEPARLKELASKICLGCLLAVTVSLPILVPAFFAFLDSGRGTSIFANVNSDLDGMHLYKKVTYLLTDCLFLFLSLVYFIKNGVKRPIDRFLAIIGGVILVPVLVDESCNLLNAGSYMSYSLRFGFLNAFYMFYLGMRVIGSLREEKLEGKKQILPLVAVGLIAVGCIGVILYINVDRLVNNTYDFSSLFAHSLGGLETIPIIMAAIFASLTACAIFYKRKALSYKVMAWIMIPVFGVQIGFYTIQLVDGNYFTPTRYDQYKEIVSIIDQTEPDAYDYYRIKDTKSSVSACAPLVCGSYSVSGFSSVLSRDNFVASQFFSYSGNGQNSLKSADGNFLGDMLLGYQYYYHHHDGGKLTENNFIIDRPYIEEVKSARLENFTAFKNKAAFPMAFTVKAQPLDFSTGTLCDNMEKLYAYLGGEGNLFIDYPLTSSGIYFDQKDSMCEIKIPFRSEGHWYLETKFPDGFDLMYNVYTRTYNPSTAKKVEGSIELAYHKEATSYYWVTLKDLSGKMTEEDVLKYCTIKCAAVKHVYNPFDMDKELFDTVTANKVDYSIEGGNTFVASVTASDDETALFLSYVALDGFIVTVNDKRIDLIQNDLKLMAVPLEKGENSVVIKYSTPYLKFAVFGLIGALLIGACIYFVTKKQKIFKAVAPVLTVMGYTLFVAVVGFFIIYPTALCLSKLIALIFV